MQVYGTSHVHSASGLKGPHNPQLRGTGGDSPKINTTDQVNFSSAAQAALESDFRSDLVSRVRNEIAQGTYESAEKLDAALDRLIDELG